MHQLFEMDFGGEVIEGVGNMEGLVHRMAHHRRWKMIKTKHVRDLVSLRILEEEGTCRFIDNVHVQGLSYNMHKSYKRESQKNV